jgi:peptidoglycan/xylan/chitin deacetylase (PgdA/CDA1 family)
MSADMEEPDASTPASRLRRRLAHRANRALGRHARRWVDDGKVALTFDDGPHPSSTPRLLDVLAEFGATATFFCVGRNALAHPELIRRALAEGHRIGSHSLTHPHPARTPALGLLEEYRRGRHAVEQVAGPTHGLFRPPNGHLDLRGSLVTRAQALRPWLWTLDPQDWRPGVSAEEILAVTRRATSTDVVLLHDWVESPLAPEALDRTATINALPNIIRTLRDQGLTFTTLPL